MKFTVHKDDFQNAVSKAERITGKNLSLPILRCVLIVAEKKSVLIRATNLDLGVEIEVPADVNREGTVAVPADILNSFLSSATSGGSLSLEMVDNHVQVTTPQSTTNITTLSHEDFPILPKISETTLFTVVGNEFADALRSVWWSATVSSIKPELSSVYVYGNGDEIVCVATDSFRLAEKKVRAKSGKDFESLLIPLKNTNEIIRYLDGYSGDVTLKGDTHQIGCVIENMYVTSRVIDGSFPDYKQIIPKEFECEITVLKQDLLDSLKQLKIFSDQFNKITITLDAKEKKSIFKTTNTEVGDATVSIDGAISGKPLTIHFNHAYILDALQAIHSDSLVLQFAGTGKPLHIKPVGDQSFSYIVMPMNR